MGRYIERAEHLARYTKVQYGASVDASLGQKKELVLESMLELAGSRQDYAQVQQQLVDEEVINFISVSESNRYSILSYIGRIRENARGARDSISTELWEAINSFYHKTIGYTETQLQQEGIEAFARKIEENSYVVKGYIENTLLRNEEWRLISLGMHLERAIQVSQILLTKMMDIEKIESARLGGALENYYWSTTLESTESFDMYMRCQKTPPNRHNVLHFLLFDPDSPKSVVYSLGRVKDCIQHISFQAEEKKGSLAYLAGKLQCRFEYSNIDEIEEIAPEFLQSNLERMYDLAHLLDIKYLNFT
jgi:uncharacterized alpha-E superfamily protein